MTRAASNLGAGPRADKRTFWLIALTVTVVLFFLLHLGTGSTNLVGPIGVLKQLFLGPIKDISQLTTADIQTLSDSELDALNELFRQNGAVWGSRLPRALYCVLAGGILGVVGSAFQAVFRNPLAEPFTVGVSSGAAVGGAIAQIIGLDAGLAFLGTPLLAFVGGMASLALVFAMARRRQGTDTTTLLIAGVVVSSLLSAILSVVIVMSGQDSRLLMSWLMGSTTPAFMERVVLMAIVLTVGAVILYRQTKRLNALAIGEDTARRLGVDPVRLRWIVLTVGTAMASAAVGTVGAVAFLGLVAPHISRSILGVDWRRSMLGSLVVGAGLMLAADLLSQRGLPMIGQLITGKELLVTEIPVGVVTALLGAPSLLILLRRTK